MKWRFDTIADEDIATRRYYTLVVLGVLLPLLLSPFLSVIFLSSGQSVAYRLICSRFLIWGELGLLLLYARHGEVQKFLLWNEERYNFWFYLLSVIALLLLIMVCASLSRIPFMLGYREKNVVMHKMQQVMNQYPWLAIFASFTAGVTEEFIFRGYIMSRLSLLFKKQTLPILISALLFSYVHLGYKNLGELIFTFLFGLVFGYHYQKYRNVKVLMVVHFLYDVYATWPALHRR